MDNCICAEWDGKGWSVCGVPCMEHITIAELDEGIKGSIEFAIEHKNSTDRIAKALAENMESRAQTLKAYRKRLAQNQSNKVDKEKHD